MNPEQEQGERLRAAFVRSVDAYTPSPAPVARIVAVGRARRLRRRAAVLAASAAVVAAGLAVPLSRLGDGPAPGTVRQLPPTATHRPAPTPPTPVPWTALIGHGTVDGRPWSVTAEFYPTDPREPGERRGPRIPGVPTQPEKTSLLCQRMLIGGVRIDHQGGPWSDCDGVDGPRDPGEAGSAGLWGLYQRGTSGSRLLVSHPAAGTSHGVVTLTGGSTLTGRVVAVPGTAFRGWVVAIPAGRTIAAVDEYDAAHRRVSHTTEWR
ncbi:hypothetical protein [Streptomyces sp. NBC_01190]|uniref:hypothetical protein n=1 Tax=Streptomyces sp. NBC_01190 TaxID=2903767 RepID=UPI00386CC15B|nr:hypothetical protein OG519_32465 [Streptomyces sp. NBC_01190]